MDITMCNGGKCPLKETCYRFRAIPSKWQSYFVKPPHRKGKCKQYWPVRQMLNAAIRNGNVDISDNNG